MKFTKTLENIEHFENQTKIFLFSTLLTHSESTQRLWKPKM